MDLYALISSLRSIRDLVTSTLLVLRMIQAIQSYDADLDANKNGKLDSNDFKKFVFSCIVNEKYSVSLQKRNKNCLKY